MSDARRQSQYDVQMRLGPASQKRNASHSNTSAAPLGLTSDSSAFHGPGHQEFNQMHDLLGTADPFPIHQEQEYNTERGLSHLHQREDEIDLPAAAHSSGSHFHAGLAQDSFGKNVDEYMQRPTAPAWNPAIAAQQSPNTLSNTLQRIQLGVPHLTPPRQQVHLISDEGYYTYQRSQQDTRSERSDRSGSLSQMIHRPQAIPRTIPDRQRARALSPGQASDYSMDSQQTPARGVTKSDTGSNVGTIQCRVEGCPELSKTPSDYKKHLARHKLEHVCPRDDCPRNKQGFATINDLNRHMVTVHKLRPKGTRIYRCFAPGCSKPEKDWPRKDNFRSHLKKAHPNEDIEDLTRQSEEAWDRRHLGPTGSAGHDMSMASAPPVTEPAQRITRPEVTFSSSPASDSGHAQRILGPQARLSQHMYIPQGAQYASRPMPGTTQFVDWENDQQRQQVAAAADYQHNQGGFIHARSSGLSSSGLQHSSSVTLPEQHSSHQYRASIAAPTMTYARTELHTDHDQMQDWELPFASAPAATYLSRTTGFYRPGLQVPAQNHTTRQRPRTEADFRAQREDRHDEMEGFPAYQDFHNSADIEYSVGGDILSGVGFSMGGGMFDSAFAQDPMPEIRVQQPEQMDTDRTSEDNAGDVNVSRLKEFLEPFNARADDDPAKRQMKSFLTNALLSLESSTGDASSAASNFGVHNDRYIEQYPNASKRTVFRCTWPECNSSKEWSLRSEIKKHMKRHSKPYGCTFDKCYRQFGSKSDWIRHETKRHALPESWRCILPKPRVAPAIQPCRKVFRSKQQFVAHLSDVHKLTKENKPEEFTSQITEQHISANFQPQYWCGFHKDIIRLAKTGKEGIHERYNHIAEHITGEGKRMDDWMPCAGILSRGDLRAKFPPKQGQLPPNAAAAAADDDDDEGDDDASPPISTSEESTSTNDNDGSPSPPQETFQTEPPPPQHRQQVQQLQPQPPRGPAPTAHAGQKRTASAAALPHSAQHGHLRRANYWQCHACQYQNLLATSAACTSMNCSHKRCPLCTPTYKRSKDEQ